MPSPFPGMDPYLENAHRWPNLHTNLMTEIQAALNNGICPKYVARVETRVYISDDDDPGRSVIIPDVRVVETPEAWRHGLIEPVDGGVAVVEPIVIRTVLLDEISEAYLEIRDALTGEVVTVIEVLSPSNKVNRARGMDSFRNKRIEVLESSSHFVEIDLLRAGSRTVINRRLSDADYLVHVSPAEMRPKGFIWPIMLPQPLPVISIPLRKPDPDAKLDLQALLTSAYDRSGYKFDTDYTHEPEPPLPPKYREWADSLLRAKGLRT